MVCHGSPLGGAPAGLGCMECFRRNAVTPAHLAWHLATAGRVDAGAPRATDVADLRSGAAVSVHDAGRYVPAAAGLRTAGHRAAMAALRPEAA